jgi:hypothetical protein
MNTTRELYRVIRATLVEMLKLKTIAEDRVRTGIHLPISDPFGPVIIPDDLMPLLILSTPQITINKNGLNGSAKLSGRDCNFQVDGYLKHDIQAAIDAGLTVDQYLDKQRDIMIDQTLTEIEKQHRFKFDGVLNGEAQLWPTNIVQNNYDTGDGSLVATFSMTVNAQYDMDRIFDSLNKLTLVNVTILSNDTGDSVQKSLQIDFSS